MVLLLAKGDWYCLSHDVFGGLNGLRSVKLLAEFLAKSELLRKLVDTLVVCCPLGSKALVRAQSVLLCLTLCDSMECSSPGSSIHEILQTRIMEWVAVSFSREYTQPRDGTLESYIGRKIIYH